MSAHRDLGKRLEVGRAVAIGRDNGVAWKVLMRVYGGTERQLRRDRDMWFAQMSDNSAEMSGFTVCLDNDDLALNAHAFATREPVDEQARGYRLLHTA